ncbi:unnamed protein product [Calypogeia fissa]
MALSSPPPGADAYFLRVPLSWATHTTSRNSVASWRQFPFLSLLNARPRAALRVSLLKNKIVPVVLPKDVDDDKDDLLRSHEEEEDGEDGEEIADGAELTETGDRGDEQIVGKAPNI